MFGCFIDWQGEQESLLFSRQALEGKPGGAWQSGCFLVNDIWSIFIVGNILLLSLLFKQQEHILCYHEWNFYI